MIALVVIFLIIGFLAAAAIVAIGGLADDADAVTLAAVAVLGRVSITALILAAAVAVIATFMTPVLSLFGPVLG